MADYNWLSPQELRKLKSYNTYSDLIDILQVIDRSEVGMLTQKMIEQRLSLDTQTAYKKLKLAQKDLKWLEHRDFHYRLTARGKQVIKSDSQN